MSIIFILSVLIFIMAVIIVKPALKANIAIAAVISFSVFSSWISVKVITGENFNETLYGGLIFGDIYVRLDALSAWFVLLTNFTVITGALYGKQYLKHYQKGSSDRSLHHSAYILNHAAITSIYFLQHSLTFLCAWEIMALTAFILVIFEYERFETLKAGINYLIQSHISIIMLTLGFIWLYSKTGSFDFNAITSYCMTGGKGACQLLFIVFLAGFGIKAGFIPFHTWLPHAHPAAPSHVSGVMSGIIIKTGIYGIMRMIILMPDNKLVIGYIILILSVITGVYGVMLAIIQHNLKRLLAYHSIENIGIIGIGIGIGTIGAGLNNPYMAFTGYAGALLHTLNHSLFKSLLFFTSGNIYHAFKTLIIDKMGGLIHKMPVTAFLFLIASLAICGLPPFNGFISEFLIYSGLFNALGNNLSPLTIVLTIVCLALIGGLAMLCFTKAFGIIFLGTPRIKTNEIKEESSATLFPLFLIVGFIVLIGLFPQYFIRILQSPVKLFTPVPAITEYGVLIKLMQKISIATWLFLLLILVLYTLRNFIIRSKPQYEGLTWGCGYNTDSPKLQYTASSFVRPYVKIIKPVIEVKKSSEELQNIIPEKIHSESHFYDKLEKNLVDWPVKNIRGFLGRFKFLQNGSVQFYVLYGVVFIFISIAIPLIIDAILYLNDILKQL